MNKEKVYQLLKDNIITINEAMKYLSESDKVKYDVETWDKYEKESWNDVFEYNDSWEEAYESYADEPFDDPAIEQLRHEGNLLRTELNWMVKMWTGLYKTGFKALTPDIMSQLYKRCQNIQHVCLLNRDIALANAKNKGCDPIEIREFESIGNADEMAVLECIVNSWHLSNGDVVTQTKYKTPTMSDIDTNMLVAVKVEPWEAPPCPKLLIPERPAVILEVMSVDGDQVSAGWCDVFNPIVIVDGLTVDEELLIGDKIIVKGSSWNSKTMRLKDPEYDGMAEPDCPVSTEEELLALKYTFNPEKEQAKLLEKHKKAWMRQHWKLLTEAQILKIAGGASVEDVIELIDSDENLQLIQDMKKLINWSIQYENDYDTYKNYSYQKYKNDEEVYRYTNNKYIVNKIASGIDLDSILKLKVT